MISVLLPTRKRPGQLHRAIDSAQCSVPIEFVCYVDSDDDSYHEADFPGVIFVRGPRIVLSNCWNKCAAVARGEIFCQGNDDIIFRTPGWDRMVEDAFASSEDKILMVHGSDGSDKHNDSGSGKFAPHPFVHRRWFEVLGYFTPPFFSSDYGDSWINDLANGIGRRQYLPFVIEHMHFIFGKAETDSTTSERLTRHSADNVSKLYADLAPLRALDIEKLKAAM
jgi:hypothetical protein